MALMMSSLLIIGFATYRAWTQRSYVAMLPVQARLIDARPDHYTRLLTCPAGQPDCPGQIKPMGPHEVEILGNPAAARYPEPGSWRARTPWSLWSDRNRIYLGMGDADNQGRNPLISPVPLIAFHPASQRFVQETELPEEQLERFYRFDGQRFIAGDDPSESWDWGNLYVGENGGWEQRRTLPQFIHVHALAHHQGRLYAGGSVTGAVPEGNGDQRYGSAVAVSSDAGISWRSTPLGGWRIHEFLQPGGKLYAIDAVPGSGLRTWLDKHNRQPFHANVYELGDNQRWIRRPDITAAQLFPATPLARGRTGVVTRAVQWKDDAVFLAAFATRRGEAPLRAAYRASRLDHGDIQVERLPFGDDTQVQDVKRVDDRLWALTSRKMPGERWLNRLLSSTDGQAWALRQAFEAPAPGKSFARLEQATYVGLGGGGAEPSVAGLIVALRPIDSAPR